jgi:putative protease
MKKIELLSPAGNMESLIAAVEAGCDAVYLGGTLFGARAFAGNFNNDELVEAINYCHSYGVKVYVTTNILIYEHEVDHFMEYIDFLHKNNVDAVLIQDLGMLDLVHKTYPNLECHASTQMHIHNLDGVIMANKLGCKRVVLARETPIEVVKEIIEKTNVDIEIFAHGALCVSYSGQCLFSSLIGNRSGNRGSCVGSCRLPYKIVNKDNQKLNDGDYPLSMKDLNTLEYVGELIEAGVTSLKIEGRMKSPEYVYTVTKLYREAIDSYYEKKEVFIDKKELNNLQKLFSRGFTKGYLFNEKIDNILNTQRPNHQGIYIGKIVNYNNNFVSLKLVSDVSINDGLRIVLDDEDYGLVLNEFYINKKLVKEAHSSDTISFKVNKKIPINSKVLLTKDSKLVKTIDDIIKKHERKVPVTCIVNIKKNEPLTMFITDYNNCLYVYGKTIEESKNRPILYEDVLSKMNKINDTIYCYDSLKINLDENVFLSYKDLNDLRHQLFMELDKCRLYKSNYQKNEYSISLVDYPHEELRSVLVSKNDNYKYDIIYSESDDSGIRKLPKVINNYQEYDNNKEYLVGELGAINYIKNFSCDYSFNVTNSYTLALLHSLSAKRVTLSVELSSKQIENIINGYTKRYNKKPNVEVIVSSYREVMCLKTNLNKIYNEDELYLVDRFNNKYRIRDYNGLSYIYEYKKFNDNYNYYDIGVNVLRDEKVIGDYYG